jgi:hypothetical protein
MECIKGPKNIVANTLSHIKITSDMESLDMADWKKYFFGITIYILGITQNPAI